MYTNGITTIDLFDCLFIFKRRHRNKLEIISDLFSKFLKIFFSLKVSFDVSSFDIYHSSVKIELFLSIVIWVYFFANSFKIHQ